MNRNEKMKPKMKKNEKMTKRQNGKIGETMTRNGTNEKRKKVKKRKNKEKGKMKNMEN